MVVRKHASFLKFARLHYLRRNCILQLYLGKLKFMVFKQLLLMNLKAAIGSMEVNGHVMRLCITLQRAFDLLVMFRLKNKWCNRIKS